MVADVNDLSKSACLCEYYIFHLSYLFSFDGTIIALLLTKILRILNLNNHIQVNYTSLPHLFVCLFIYLFTYIFCLRGFV